MSDAEFVDEAAELIGRIAALEGDDRIAAACRGSANPAALRWLSETLALAPNDLVTDLGAGLGGPAAWMRDHVGCAVMASDPSPTAAGGAYRLFELVSLQATAASAPFVDDAFEAVLLLGVLSVVDDRIAVIHEARRIGRRIGVLDFCSTTGDTLCVGGSHFPTADQLTAEIAGGWRTVDARVVDEPTPTSWERAAERAHAGVERPDSEREVVAAIEAGRLAAHAFVGR